DYTPRQTGNLVHNFEISTNMPLSSSENLYNGNIGRMITSVRNTKEDILPSQVNNYNYDQLNRIFDMKTWQYLGFNNSSFTVKNSYNSSYEYDRNGNLLKLTRTAPTKPDHPDVVPMDNLSYSNNPSTNQLNYVMDDVHPDTFSVDIDNQKPHNYIYDEIG